MRVQKQLKHKGAITDICLKQNAPISPPNTTPKNARECLGVLRFDPQKEREKMNLQSIPNVRQAEAGDAADLAKLIDIAGEGIPAWLWGQSCGAGQTPLDVGTERARREVGGFSYKNALVAEKNGATLGMVLSYPINEAPTSDPNELPAPIAPFVELEAQSVGTWYINALAVFAGARGAGLGTRLLTAAEDQAAAAGYRQMSIQVYGQNSGAFRLYQRLGYGLAERAAVRLHPCQPYYTGDVLLLLKSLTA